MANPTTRRRRTIPPLSSYLNAFVRERSDARLLAPLTARDYRYDLSGWLADIGDPAPRDLTARMITEWVASKRLAASTARSRVSKIRTFLEWCVEAGIMDRNPAVLVKAPKEPRRLPRGLTAEQVAALLDVAPDARARLIILLMVQEGLRRKEVAELDLGSIDTGERTMLVRGKGNHERVLPITEQTWAALRSYLSECPASAGPLIRAQERRNDGVGSRWDDRRGVTAPWIGRMMSDWMTAAGIKQRAHDGRSAHALRHTAASDMLRNGAHVRDVQAALGHVSIVTTQRYLPLVVGDLRESMGGRRYGR